MMVTVKKDIINGRVYDQTHDPAKQGYIESQENTKEANGCFKEISLIGIKASKNEFLNFRKR